MKCKLCKTRVSQPNIDLCEDCDTKDEFKQFLKSLETSGFSPVNK